MFLTSSLSSKGIALPLETSGRRALDSAGPNRIKKRHYFIFFLSVFIARGKQGVEVAITGVRCHC